MDKHWAGGSFRGQEVWVFDEVQLKNIYCMTFFFFFFRATPTAYGGSQARGLNQSRSGWPTPQPQQRGIQGASVTYTMAHVNARSLTHWMRPGIKLASSWILVGFITRWAIVGTLFHDILLVIGRWGARQATKSPFRLLKQNTKQIFFITVLAGKSSIQAYIDLWLVGDLLSKGPSFCCKLSWQKGQGIFLGFF